MRTDNIYRTILFTVVAGLLLLSAIDFYDTFTAPSDMHAPMEYMAESTGDTRPIAPTPKTAQPVLTVTARDWVALFAQNEVRGNREIGGKVVRVTDAQVLGIETGGFMLGDTINVQIGSDGNARMLTDPFALQLLGNGSLLGMGMADSMLRNRDYRMYLNFPPSQAAAIAKLSKGDPITAICIAETGTARGKDCILDLEYEPEKANAEPPAAATDSKPTSETGEAESDGTNKPVMQNNTKTEDVYIDEAWEEGEGTPTEDIKTNAPLFKKGDKAKIPPDHEVNLRSAPNVSSPLVVQLRRNAQLKIMGDTATRHEDEGNTTQWVSVELYRGEYCLPTDLAKQAICTNWQSINPESPQSTTIKGWVNSNKIVKP
jgi:hypothetical protein